MKELSKYLYTVYVLLLCAYFNFSSTKTTSLFTYNEKLQDVLLKHRNPEEKKLCDKLKSHKSEVSESQTQCIRSLTLRLNEPASADEAREEANCPDAKDNSSRRSSLSKDPQVI